MTRVAPRDRSERGFTLVELMVALTAGIAVAGAAYILSQSSLDIFKQEERMAAAQSAATLGMNRMLSDVQRAGFMMSPNITADVAKRCGATGTYANLLGVRVLTKGSGSLAPAGGTGAGAAASIYNGLNNGVGMDPDRIRIAGNFSSTEQFEFRQIDNVTVYLSIDRGSTQRTLQQADYGGASLRDIFRPNRWARIVDGTGHENYRQITAVSCNGGGICTGPNVTSMTITLNAKPTTDETCGPGATRGLINPISIVDYWIGKPVAADSVSPDVLASIAPVKPLLTGDDSRTELLRTEYFDNAGALQPIPRDAVNPNAPYPTEIVSEYAVDLAFGATVRVAPFSAATPTLNRLEFQSGAIAGTAPEHFVSLTARLITRTRAPDRPDPAPAAPLSRFAVFQAYPVPPGTPPNTFGTGTAATTNYFARTRSLTAEINLPNLAGTDW